MLYILSKTQIDFKCWPSWWLYLIVSHCGFKLYSLPSTEFEHLLICLLFIWISSSVEYLLKSLAYFSIALSPLFLMDLKTLFYVLDLISLLNMDG